MPPAACFFWAGRLAAAVTMTPRRLAHLATPLDVEPATCPDVTAWLAAAEMLVQWPERLEDFLDVFREVDKHKATATGVNRRFGTLLRRAAWLESLAHPAPAEALRHYLLERYIPILLSQALLGTMGATYAAEKKWPTCCGMIDLQPLSRPIGCVPRLSDALEYIAIGY